MNERIQTQFMVMSFSHKNAAIDIREKLNFATEQIVPFLQKICASEAIKEAILLCTCNRVEIYTSILDRRMARDHIYQCLTQEKQISLESLQDIVHIYLNQYAIYHIFCVASSLDSLVVGETQITGQLKVAYKLSYDHALCSKDMTRLMHFAFKCAAHVRAHTDISSNSVSVASAAVNMAEQKLQEKGESLDSVEVLLIGSGEMGRLVAKHLSNHQAKITLLNRSEHNAQNLAQEIKANMPAYPIVVKPYEILRESLKTHRVVFVATTAKDYVIKSDMIVPHHDRRLYFDLSVPRNIETMAIPHTEIYSVDDLQEIVDQNKTSRQESAKVGLKIVDQFTADFFKWLQTLSIDPIIKQMRYLAKQSAMKELERAIKKGYLPQEYEKNVEKILHGAFNTFLHQPTMRLRQASENPQGDPIIEATKNIFDISDDVVMLNGYKCEKDTTIY
uniref:Glutamyl-tRNA reductase n=1 Tax=uncultured Helicobacter sp. TaxID=175537 RepID=A0A650EKX0_9HELI|nr:glutamyl-tRNA reductase [uncultured Helicobacter sp.]